MKAATVKEIKTELENSSHAQLVEYCLRLAKFKKDSKELLTYLLFEAMDEGEYIREIRKNLDTEFAAINPRSYYLVKKSVRKILRDLNKYIRYSGKKETKVELLLHFCYRMQDLRPSFKNNLILSNLYERQIAAIRKTMEGLHEDLQFDYQKELESLDQ